MNKQKFFKLLEKVECGSVNLTDPEGNTYTFTGDTPGTHCDLQIHRWDLLNLISKKGDIGLGEAYMKKMWDSTDPAEFICFVAENFDAFKAKFNGSFLNRILFFLYNNYVRANTKLGSKQNILAHYDLGNDFYSSWLDPTMTYSSALRLKPTDSLEVAQINKYNRIIDKLNIKDADVLEIGCGWGGFADLAAQSAEKIDSITISKRQYEFAKERLGTRGNVIFKDYRDVRKVYDRIVSIEMFEAVGEKYWGDYFKTLKRSLVQSGKALIQTIYIKDEFFESYKKTSDYIRHHIFPGGMLPSPTKFRKETLKAGLEPGEFFEFGLEYAWTLRSWKENIAKTKDKLLEMGYTDQFLRGWDFYLDFCTAGFKLKKIGVMQAEISNT